LQKRVRKRTKYFWETDTKTYTLHVYTVFQNHAYGRSRNFLILPVWVPDFQNLAVRLRPSPRFSNFCGSGRIRIDNLLFFSDHTICLTRKVFPSNSRKKNSYFFNTPRVIYFLYLQFQPLISTIRVSGRTFK